MRGAREESGRTEEAKLRTGPSKLLGPALVHRVWICLFAHLLPGRAENQGPGVGPQLYSLYPQTTTVTLRGGLHLSLGLSFHFCKMSTTNQ